MADGMNEVRALRLAEMMQDFRNLQYYISQIQAVPTAEEYNGHGYVLLRQCNAEGQAILNAPFTASKNVPAGNAEREKQHLQYVMLDAATRRFQAQRIYLRATAAMRWINSRNTVLQGGRPTAAHQASLHQVDQQLQGTKFNRPTQELAGITDQKILADLRSADERQGKWIDEDPNQAQIAAWVTRQASASNNSGGSSSRRR